MRHDFQTACDIRLKIFRRTFLFSKRSVDAVTDAVAFFHRLHVNIGSLHIERIDDDLRNEFDDRRIVFRAGALPHGEGSVLCSVGDLLHVVGCGELVGDQVQLFLVGPVCLDQQAVDLLLRRHDGVHIALKDDPDGVQRIHIGRIAHCDGQDVVMNPDGNHLVLPRQVGWQLGCDCFGDLVIRKVHQFQSILFTEYCQQFSLVQVSELLQCVDDAQFAAGLGDGRPSFGDLIVGHQVILPDQLENIIIVFRHFPHLVSFRCGRFPNGGTQILSGKGTIHS